MAKKGLQNAKFLGFLTGRKNNPIILILTEEIFSKKARDIWYGSVNHPIIK